MASAIAILQRWRTSPHRALVSVIELRDSAAPVTIAAMMKMLALALCSTLALGCSDKKSTNKAEGPSPAPAKAAEPAKPEPAKTPTPTSSVRIGCDAEIALECGAGFADGCVGNKTKVHICVANDAKVASGCETEIVYSCPDGQIDGCMLNPSLQDRKVTDNHVCVVK